MSGKSAFKWGLVGVRWVANHIAKTERTRNAKVANENGENVKSSLCLSSFY